MPAPAEAVWRHAADSVLAIFLSILDGMGGPEARCRSRRDSKETEAAQAERGADQGSDRLEAREAVRYADQLAHSMSSEDGLQKRGGSVECIWGVSTLMQPVRAAA